jgi:hypothetical protein
MQERVVQCGQRQPGSAAQVDLDLIFRLAVLTENRQDNEFR